MLSIMIMMKMWFFPLMIYLWFPTDDLSSTLLESIDIMTGLFSLLFYIGFGSLTKYQYQFNTLEAIALFVLLHLIILCMVPFVHVWSHLLSDAFILYSPSIIGGIWELIGMYFCCFLFGRKLEVKEAQQKLQHQKQRLRA